MAVGKKKVIVYTDWIDQFKDLTDEEAGKLIKHFFDYVNDLNPKSDRITELLFNPIKATLKRDLEAWENKQQTNKENGLKGGRPKKEITEINPNNPNGFLITQDNPEKGVSVSVSVNDSVNVNDKVIKEKIKPKKVLGEISIIYPFDSENFKNKWSVWKEFKQKEYSFKYKSEISEGSALKKLNELSNQNENIAIQIIEQSISNGWAGLFELKNNQQFSKPKTTYLNSGDNVDWYEEAKNLHK